MKQDVCLTYAFCNSTIFIPPKFCLLPPELSKPESLTQKVCKINTLSKEKKFDLFQP